MYQKQNVVSISNDLGYFLSANELLGSGFTFWPSHDPTVFDKRQCLKKHLQSRSQATYPCAFAYS